MSVDAELAIQEERTAKLFGECAACRALVQYGVCQFCQPEEWRKRHARALKNEAEEIAARQRAFAEKNKPIAELAVLLETRRDAHQYRSMCAALRDGRASDLQIRLARRLTKPSALKRARKRNQ